MRKRSDLGFHEFYDGKLQARFEIGTEGSEASFAVLMSKRHGADEAARVETGASTVEVGRTVPVSRD